MHSGDKTRQIEAVRQKTIAVLEDMVEKAGDFELAQPPPALEEYRRKLEENAYEVLVVGEAKRGKSTFVNALIGQDILPTDVDVSTSQVFNIRPSDTEAYRLRFEDGSAQKISREELPLYGSQVMSNAGTVPTLDQIIRWIEADVPIRFLPAGVSIVDTPGLGALYAGHAQITHRLVPEAEAVIFVLESEQPLIQVEVEFIEEILEVTPNIFFIQTKIDRFDETAWREVQRRNQDILQSKFEYRLADTRVWPVSSTHLQKAASAPEAFEEAYLMRSRHEEMAVALQAFLSSVAGWSRVAEAMLVAGQYHSVSHKVLSGRLAGFAAESKQQRDELKQLAVESKRRFDADWGLQGKKQEELRKELQQAIDVGRRSFNGALQAGGEIERAQDAKINVLTSLKGANQVAEVMHEEVAAATVDKWVRVCKEVQYRCVELLEPLAVAADGIGAPLDASLPDSVILDGPLDSQFKYDYLMMISGAASGGMIVTTAGSAAAGMTAALFGTAVLGSIAWPALALAIPAYLLLAGAGIQGVFRGQIESAKQELRAHLTQLRVSAYKHFFEVDLGSGRYSMVDEYFGSVKLTVNEQIQELLVQKSEEANAEIARLRELVKLDDQQRGARPRKPETN